MTDEQVHGEYRTKRLILEIYDELAEAIATGRPYQTRLDPPPADPRVASPPRSSSGPAGRTSDSSPAGPLRAFMLTVVVALWSRPELVTLVCAGYHDPLWGSLRRVEGMRFVLRKTVRKRLWLGAVRSHLWHRNEDAREEGRVKKGLPATAAGSTCSWRNIWREN